MPIQAKSKPGAHTSDLFKNLRAHTDGPIEKSLDLLCLGVSTSDNILRHQELHSSLWAPSCHLKTSGGPTHARFQHKNHEGVDTSISDMDP